MPAPPPTGTATWLDPEWRTKILAWAEETLAPIGMRVDGTTEQPHIRPWSTVFRIPTDRGAVWLKAAGPASAHEGPLLEVFRRRGVEHVLLPLAVHPAKPWILFDDGGPTLRQVRPLSDDNRDLGDWERLLVEYASLQRSLESNEAVDAMLASGTPDGRPSVFVHELGRLLDDDAAWRRLTAEERDQGAAARSRLDSQAPLIADLAAELSGSGVRASVQHDDLHDGNVLVGANGDRFFDWGDAAVAHPFATLTVTFNSIAHKTGLAQDDPAFVRLETVYLEAWTDVASRPSLQRAASLARVFGCVARSLAWERALAGLTPDEMADDGDAVAGWLIEFSDRLDAIR
jgi:hypothetical protein